MFALVVLWGVFSYVVLILGWVGWLHPVASTLSLVTCLAVSVFICLYNRKTISSHIQRAFLVLRSDRLVLCIGLILSALSVINLMGALGPELGFDALWYHLTIPRIWLLEGRAFNIPGGYFYYSLLPKSIDLMYLSLLPIWGYIGPKILHWLFGLMAAGVTYKIARKWLDVKWSAFAALIFYSNLVVGWQSITAYVDLGRTMVEALAFYYLLQKQNVKSAVILGWAITTKFLAIGSLPVFLIIWLWQKQTFKQLLTYAIVTLLIPSPWWIWAYLQTGNPFYPIFSGYDLTSARSGWDVLTIWVRSPDPLTPVYAMVSPLWLIFRRKVPTVITIYCIGTLAVWWLIPRTGGGRFLLPYLPVFSVLAAYLISEIKAKALQTVLVGCSVVIVIVNMGWRFLANVKYVPVIMHTQSEQDFLQKNLYPFGHNFYYLPDDQLKKLYE